MLAQAFGHAEAGRLAEAHKQARQLERVRPDLPGLAYLHGLIALGEGNGKKAAQQLAKALAQTPDALPPLLAMARAQVQQHRLDAADLAYRRVLASAPSAAEAYAELGDLRLRQDRFEAALAPLRHATALRPDWARVQNNLGVAERALGRLAEAALSFARAIDADPASAKAHANLAGVLRRLKRPGESVEMAQQAVALEPAVAAHWLELGQARRDAGDLDAAVDAFAEASRLAPDWTEAVWLGAEALAALGRAEEAAEAYRRVLVLDSADGFGAALALAGLGAAPLPAEAPSAFVRSLFDQYAGSFDQDLVEHLHYQGPALLADAIHRSLGAGPFALMDAGCGTGLLGQVMRPSTIRLDGVDLSPQMVEKARARGIYNELVTGDLVAALAARPARYDVVAAADVLIYLGDLRPAMRAAADSLRPGGGFVFTVEKADGDGFVLLPSRRYAHSLPYLVKTAQAAGFTVQLLEEAVLRTDRRKPVAALVVVLGKA